MIDYLLKFLAIYVTCLFKFVAGPILGSAAGYSIFEITIVSVAGMMTSVFLISYLGDWIKTNWSFKVSKKRNKFSKKNRRIVKVWQKFGPIGIAAITPMLLTPIGGTIIMSAFRVEKKVVFTYMFLSGVFWAIILGASINQILSIPIVDKLIG
ncbi:hypothetical protein Belba_0482 [Belliella baltica DSM 15883]|uniref:Small multi-drug export protein n=1 Tax=Belliella baltica (strain DSM 15883 / CIP 108006 / LMG 21964 / BA134) TaxID=866536 RepID=I3Z1M3_BELBD|nr:hypothetical protein [Belliella baltica]AFL83141.1 hypothetical protein Belba_0482 [Belliella baltica DSM 15883]